MEQHRAQNRVESLHKTHLLVVAHAQFISREVTKKIIEATESNTTDTFTINRKVGLTQTNSSSISCFLPQIERNGQQF